VSPDLFLCFYPRPFAYVESCVRTVCRLDYSCINNKGTECILQYWCVSCCVTSFTARESAAQLHTGLSGACRNVLFPTTFQARSLIRHSARSRPGSAKGPPQMQQQLKAALRLRIYIVRVGIVLCVDIKAAENRHVQPSDVVSLRA